MGSVMGLFFNRKKMLRPKGSSLSFKREGVDSVRADLSVIVTDEFGYMRPEVVSAWAETHDKAARKAIRRYYERAPQIGDREKEKEAIERYKPHGPIL